MSLPGCLRVQPDGEVLLSVKVQPRASKNEIGEVVANELKIKVTAPPVDSAANQALIELLAAKLGSPKGTIRIVRGQKARHKVVAIRGVDAPLLVQRLLG